MTAVTPPTPMLAMNGNDMTASNMNTKSDSDTSIATPHGMWTTPVTTQSMRPRPATIHEGFSYCMSEASEALNSWDSSALSVQQTPSDTMSRPLSVHQDFYPMTTMDTGMGNSWQKTCDDSLDLQMDSDMGIGQAYTTDEAIPILNLRYSSGAPMDGEPLHYEGSGMNPRRLSGSSFTMSTSGGLSDMPSYEDFSADLSDAPSLSDYPPPSNRNSLMSSTQLSPVASPRMTPQSRSELVRTQSRGRASPSPRPGLRAAPYSMDGPRNKRWSTGSYGTMPSRRSTPYMYHGATGVGGTGIPMNTSGALEPFGPRLATTSSHHSSPTVENGQLPLNMGNLQQATMAAAAATLPSQNPYFFMLLPTQLPSHAGAMAYQHPHMDPSFSGLHNHNHMIGQPMHPQHTVPSHIPLSQFNVSHAHLQHHHHHGGAFDPASQQQLMSHSIFRMLQSNGDPHSLHGHYADLSDPPDLYASLNDEQLAPPPEDMNPSDPDMVPHEQELRFNGDLYTPRWVRGHGNKREGWCGICKPGRWLVLKNSAFWYDKSFTHGISAATGNPFQEPLETRRMDGNPDVWEGLCSSCNEWVALVSSKKKGTTWFRHAYKCHTHPKIKDAPKRRRESSHNRLSGGTSAMSSAMSSLVRSRPNSQSGQSGSTAHMQGQGQGPTSAALTSTATTPMPHTPMPNTPMPQTPMTPQFTPTAASASLAHGQTPVTSVPTTTTPTRHIPAPIQIPLPVSLGMTVVAGSPLPPAPSVTSMPSMEQQHQHHQQYQQSLYAPLGDPPAHAPPPIPPRSQLRLSRQGAQFDAMVQQQQQQPRTFQHVRPPPPPPNRHMMTPMAPLAPVEGLGNVI
ncbi:fungal protein [Ophiostoma piceae UAMH 11346]|uniref:Fungal protein n=1 Tax=Ophiostoma piceae (strain UAMH 11346) TaxID=1262450 RepID=S3CY88_OPHP1|nr:fungal protein [Ophiostoma piceae UAMH 11346]